MITTEALKDAICFRTIYLEPSARFIIDNSNCKFNNDFFVQINCTVMGIIFAPTNATLIMGSFALTIYRICINEIGETLSQFILENCCPGFWMTTKHPKLTQIDY